jgi:lysophospholipase L1-like esterase
MVAAAEYATVSSRIRYNLEVRHLMPKYRLCSGVSLLLAAMLVTLISCSPGTEQEKQQAGRDAARTTAQQGTTTSGGRSGDVPAPEDETTMADSRVRWDYVALGDSLAVGIGASRGYVTRYAEHLQSDTDANVRVTNLGVSGQTSSQLLHSLRADPEVRRALRGAEVVTLNIGLNDLGQAGSAYQSGTCGGPRNQACLRRVVEKVERNWDAIIKEISRLRSPRDTIIRTVGLGYTPRTEGVFGPYLTRVTRHIDSVATGAGIPNVDVRLGEEGMSEDGLHPNDTGYRLISNQLRHLGYEPLYSR